MKPSGIGGQAVLEGVMMKNADKYAVAVRQPDGEITVKTGECHSISEKYKVLGVPFVRGVVNFIESLTLGMSTLTYSASFSEDEEETSKLEKKLGEKATMGLTVAGSLVLAIAIFMLLPFFIASLLGKVIGSDFWLAVIEGVMRIVIFVGYVLAISLMEDIKRVFMYHGAEHKCINCIEHGLPLTVKNVRKQTTRHKRCGTSFMLIVIVLSAIFFMFIRVDNMALRVVLRLVLIPVIAGVSYEFLKLAGRSENPVINVLSKPGLWLQALTTREPDDDMIEVGIASVEAVFDWEAFLADNGKKAKKDKKQDKVKKEEKEAEQETVIADTTEEVEIELAEPVSDKAAQKAEAEKAAKEEAERKAAQKAARKAEEEAERKAAAEAKKAAKAAAEEAKRAAAEEAKRAAAEAEQKAKEEAERKAAEEAEAAKNAEPPVTIPLKKATGSRSHAPVKDPGVVKDDNDRQSKPSIESNAVGFSEANEDDEILNALDRFFTYKREEAAKKDSEK